MKEHDKPIMNHCIDIKFDKVSELEQKFIFTFSSNPFFTNEKLYKTIFYSDPGTPVRSEGTEINWNPN